MRTKLFFLGFILMLSEIISHPVQAQEVEFDPFEWADTRLAQVYFKDNPQSDKAFFITPPKGWVSIKDLTKMFNTDLVKKMSKAQILSRFQSVYPYVVIAKSLDALAWNLDPYNFRAPISELQNFAVDFLLDQYAEYRKIIRQDNDQTKLYNLLVEEVGDQEFSLKVSSNVCDKPSMKRSCTFLKSRHLMFDLADTSLDFDIVPKSIEQFKQEIIPQLSQWFAASRRLYVFRKIVSAAEEKNQKKQSIIVKKDAVEEKEDLSPKFFELLWEKISVFTYADYCAFPTLVCNRFDAQEFQLPLTNKTVEILLSIKLSDED